MAADAQKSEIHETTEDADTAPTHGREQREGSLKHHGDKLENAADTSAKIDHARSPEDQAKLYPPGTKVKQDDSDYGGEIVIETPRD